MLKQCILKFVVSLALTATLLSGFALSGAAAVPSAKVAPTQHLLACGGGGVDGFPPCE
jgi:hypothetical protein